MRKILVISASFLLTATVSSAQKIDPIKYEALFEKIDSVIYNYVSYSKFSKVGEAAFSPQLVQRYTDLFIPNAMLADDVCTNCKNKKNGRPLSVNDYVKNARSNFPNGLNVKIQNANISYKTLDDYKIFVALDKYTTANMANGNRFDTRDTVFLELQIASDLQTVKIASVSLKAPETEAALASNTKPAATSNTRQPGNTEPAVVKPVREKPVKDPDASGKNGFFVGIHAHIGSLNHKLTTVDLAGNYEQAVNTDIADLKFTKGTSIGGALSLAYYFGANRNFGIGTGIQYLSQKGTLSLDKYHVEYKAQTTSSKEVYRQLISAVNGIEEKIKITNINIPVVLKYKGELSKNIGIMVDAGIVLNASYKTSYTTNAAFDYEAIFNYDASGNAVYDAGSQPGTTSWLITKEQYEKHNDGGQDAATYFSVFPSEYNVGLNKKPDNTSDKSVAFKGDIGFLVQPSVFFQLSKSMLFQFGVYYLSQPVSAKESVAGYQLTSKTDQYNTLLKSIDKSSTSSIGATVGLLLGF